MQVNPNRDKISLEETLAFIKFINRQKPFEKQQILIPTKDLEEEKKSKKQAVTSFEKPKKAKQEDLSEDMTKKLNKNRAIKRIIESAFQILQNFNNYEEENNIQSNDKSSDIQFNIYLKQFNRVLEMIYKLQKQRLSLEDENAEKRQELLQNIYEYTVVEDFREILPVAILKDKISKTNIQIMIDSLSKNLVILKPNQLRIYDSSEITGNFRSIKLHQIQNVDYHTQPYIFLVLAIQKDKERFNVYMQFQSEKNQQKWDRALYCCYIGRKMKTKEKFFVIEYPEEDVKKKQKQQTKKHEAFQHQIGGKRKPLDRILSEKHTHSQVSREDGVDFSDNLSRANTKRKGQPLSSMSKQEKEQSVARGSREDKLKDSSAAMMARSNVHISNNSDTPRLLQVERTDRTDIQKREDLMNRIRTDYIEISKPPENENPLSPNQGLYSPNTLINDRAQSKTNIFGSMAFSRQDNRDQLENQTRYLKEEDQLPQQIVQIHNLERRNVKGLVLQKQKFFFNKAKILFLKEGSKDAQGTLQEASRLEELKLKEINLKQQYQAMRSRELQYWDFDQKSGQKSERKVIKLTSIKSHAIEEKNGPMLAIMHDKEIIFTGKLQILQEIKRWIDLIRNIYETKLANSRQEQIE